ncbi:hypothetical protein IZ6_25550 [Terrihabitans soli]|uniref:Uncharacterized protein n=1 Tax=Terrihabitans soli TaxID=708113 RepID=A0A6S6QXQ4_9HYPH|nr:hypothetical protein [Terrihabitans soli]BCJ91820.1 hypothetical protein IZ6_25550 [Terrihabitans soli]
MNQEAIFTAMRKLQERAYSPVSVHRSSTYTKDGVRHPDLLIAWQPIPGAKVMIVSDTVEIEP